MYIPKYFKAVELIDRATNIKCEHRGSAWILGILFDERLLRVIDTIRHLYGPMTVNDWSWGGANQYRGWRSPDCGIGATLSQHRFGRAVDMIPKDMSAEDIRDDLIKNQHKSPHIKFIGGLEMGISWLHVDVRTRNKDGEINLFYP